MSDLIISFVATVVFCLIIGAAIFVVDWLIGIFGTTVIIPICFFCPYMGLRILRASGIGRAKDDKARRVIICIK